MQTRFSLFFLIVIMLGGFFSLYPDPSGAVTDLTHPSRRLCGLSATLNRQLHALPSDQRMFPRAPANPVIVSAIRKFNGEMGPAEARDMARLITSTAKRHNVDPFLVTALVSQESAFHADAVSPVGALGLGQLMPFTAEELGVDPLDPAENLDGCVRYLARNLRLWSDSKAPVALALASYNAGPGAVEHFGGVPPYRETRHYVRTIRARYSWLRATYLAQKSRKKRNLG